MYCPACGKRIDGGAKFCRNCGSPLACPEEEKTPKGKRPFKKGLWGIISAAAVLLGACLLLLFSSAPTDRNIPDPAYFFSEAASVEVKSQSKSTCWVEIRGAEVFSAGFEYVELLKSGAYPFVCTAESVEPGFASYDFCYEGAYAYKEPYEYQIAVRLYYEKGTVELFYFDRHRFDFVEKERYSGTLHAFPMGFEVLDAPEPTEAPTPAPTAAETKAPTPTPKATKKATAAPKVTPTPKATKKATAAPKVTPTPKATQKATAAPVSGTRVATGIDLSYVSKAKKNGVQDIRYWSKGTIPFSKKPLDMDGFTLYKFKCERSVLEAYIRDLCQNGFTLAAEYDRTSYTGGKFIEYALTCDGASVPTMQGLYTKADCHIDIWKDDVYWRMDVADGLSYGDMGLRQGGGKESICPLGDSAEAGLLYTSGAYLTDDGRFSAKMGKADVLVKGKHKTGACTIKKKGTKKYEMTVEGFGSGTLTFSWSKEEIQGNRVYVHKDFEDGDASLTWTLDGRDMTPKAAGEVYFSGLILRVMHYDPAGEAVFYVYAETFDGEKLELLAAADLPAGGETSAQPAESPSYTGETERITVGEDTTIYMKVGQTVILKSRYNSSYDLGTMYTTYDWSCSGDAVSISGSFSELTVKGLKKGTATISLKYSYTKDEEDVLTGVMRHNAKTRKRTYTIVVE